MCRFSNDIDVTFIKFWTEVLFPFLFKPDGAKNKIANKKNT